MFILSLDLAYFRASVLRACLPPSTVEKGRGGVAGLNGRPTWYLFVIITNTGGVDGEWCEEEDVLKLLIITI